MRLNHLNLAVTDVAAAKTFLMTYFGLRDMGGGNRNRAFLMDEGGLVLSMFKGKDVTYPGTFHIGFAQRDEAAVNAIHARMTADGIVADPPQRSHGWTFYVRAPGGFLVEVLSP
jgi:catechol 2,3-dioxygenase-like lactoylglutathione lyase family enzyme